MLIVPRGRPHHPPQTITQASPAETLHSANISVFLPLCAVQDKPEKKSKDKYFDAQKGIPEGGTAVAKIVDFGETKNLHLASPLTKEVCVCVGVQFHT